MLILINDVFLNLFPVFPGSRITMLQRDLQNQMSENEKLKSHLQSLRESYTKFFGASI